MSELIYDGRLQRLTLLDNKRNVVGAWHANNRVQSDKKIRFIPDGHYSIVDQNQPYPHQKDSPSGSYGSFGIVRVADFLIGKDRHTAIGVHSGREKIPDKSPKHGTGPEHVTHGCIRTTDDAMKQIAQWMKGDPLLKLVVRNNRDNW